MITTDAELTLPRALSSCRLLIHLQDTPPPSPTDADAVLPREGTAGEGGWIRGDDSLPQLEQQNPTTSPTGPSRTQDKSSLGLELITTQEKELVSRPSVLCAPR